MYKRPRTISWSIVHFLIKAPKLVQMYFDMLQAKLKVEAIANDPMGSVRVAPMSKYGWS